MGKVTWNKDKLTLREIFGSNCVILTGRNLNPTRVKKMHEQQREKAVEEASRGKEKRKIGEEADP